LDEWDSSAADHGAAGDDSATLARVKETAHGTSAGWHTGCRCTQCRAAHADTQKAFGRARAQQRFPVELRQQLLDAIYAGKPFRTALRDLGLAPNQVWGMTKTAEEWSTALEAALTASRRVDLQHGTNAAYVRAVSARNAESTSGSGWQGTEAKGRLTDRLPRVKFSVITADETQTPYEGSYQVLEKTTPGGSQHVGPYRASVVLALSTRAARLAGRATLSLSALGQPCRARAWLVAHSSA
jgi:hypothetical protein